MQRFEIKRFSARLSGGPVVTRLPTARTAGTKMAGNAAADLGPKGI